MSKDVVIRISKENHLRLKELMDAGSSDKPLTTNKLMERMLNSLESITNGKMIYLTDGKFHEDLSIARGESIVNSVTRAEQTKWPMVAVIIGQDQGE